MESDGSISSGADEGAGNEGEPRENLHGGEHKLPAEAEVTGIDQDDEETAPGAEEGVTAEENHEAAPAEAPSEGASTEPVPERPATIAANVSRGRRQRRARREHGDGEEEDGEENASAAERLARRRARRENFAQRMNDAPLTAPKAAPEPSRNSSSDVSEPFEAAVTTSTPAPEATPAAETTLPMDTMSNDLDEKSRFRAHATSRAEREPAQVAPQANVGSARDEKARFRPPPPPPGRGGQSPQSPGVFYVGPSRPNGNQNANSGHGRGRAVATVALNMNNSITGGENFRQNSLRIDENAGPNVRRESGSTVAAVNLSMPEPIFETPGADGDPTNPEGVIINATVRSQGDVPYGFGEDEEFGSISLDGTSFATATAVSRNDIEDEMRKEIEEKIKREIYDTAVQASIAEPSELLEVAEKPSSSRETPPRKTHVHFAGKKIPERKLRRACMLLNIVGTAAIVGLAIALALIIQSASSDQESTPASKSDGSLLSACESDDACISGLCHKSRCRSFHTRSQDTCRRFDLCSNAECPNNIIPCLDANYGAACSGDGDCDSNQCVLGICSSGAVNATCGLNGDCISGLCDNDVCVLKARIGSNCTRAEQCESGICAEGFCTGGGYNSTCSLPEDCRNGFCEESGTCGRSPPGGWCDTPDGCNTRNCVLEFSVCARPANETQACTVDENCKMGRCQFSQCSGGIKGSNCYSNDHCMSGFCNDFICTGVQPGGLCRVNEDCKSQVCENGTCTAIGGDSAACTVNTECISSLCNTETKRCSPMRENGQECERSSNCSSGRCGLDSKCIDKSANGESCGGGIDIDLHQACSSRRCDYRLYECEERLGVDEVCARDDDCTTVHCNSSRMCAPEIAVGEPCELDHQCESGNCDGSDPEQFACKPQL